MAGGPDRALVQRAVDVLINGSAHTLELAEIVLGLTGNPKAAAAAVFTLLGADERFRLDAEGTWSLHGPPPGTPLRDVPYAVVDLETTGGPYARGHRVTEIAIYDIDEGVIAGDYQTLINPGRTIPPRIEVLTGITNAMVRGAPHFDEIASDIFDRLEGRVFVAHNVSFDWGFTSRQLGDAIGQVPRVERLCTVKMARRLLPRLKHRNLDTLTRYFDIPIEGRHRAWGDALATARVFLRLVDAAEQQGIMDLDALQSFLRKPRPRKRSRQGQQLELLAKEEASE
jgi:DNA polymerase III epsilon subunit family exonuclease